jgi:hypothetical protein
MKQIRMLYGGAEARKKWGLRPDHLVAYHNNPEVGIWADFYRLVMLTCTHPILRSIAASEIRWSGSSLLAIPDQHSHVIFKDVMFRGSLRTITDVTVVRDKTQSGVKTTHRFVVDGIVPGIEFSKFLRYYIKRYNLPSGWRLLSPPASKAEASASGCLFVDTKFCNWSNFIDHYCKILSLDRQHYGTHSCRRGMAQWLDECGLDQQDIQFLGFWWSLAVKEYTGPGESHAIALFEKAFRSHTWQQKQ